ncbi:hypothetical protein HYU13_01080, partial [Candidatus Woesearchaeota archaeon]|nr:hypothetical protein [Candidatus Woesearchaeota archaeon]
YFYRVSSKNVPISTVDPVETAILDNQGEMFNFTTLAKAPIFLNATIPEKLNNGNIIAIPGRTLVFAQLKLFVDGKLAEERVADSNGQFTFPSLTLTEGNHSIRLTAARENEKTEQLSFIAVDNIPPRLFLDDFPSSVSSPAFSVAGNVSEEVELKFYIALSSTDDTPPPQVQNFRNTSIEANAVRLEWNKLNIPDFMQYILYRDEIPIIAFENITYTDFTDFEVNTAQPYIYKIAAMDKSGNIGEQAGPLLVRTLPSGISSKPRRAEIDPFEAISGLQKTVKANGKFNETIQLEDQDQFYTLKVQAIDSGGNQDAETEEILLDQTPPEIEILSPAPGGSIYESFADQVTIRGRTEPGARVYLFIERSPLGEFDQAGEIAGFPQSLETIPEADLKADCDFKILGTQECKSHADYDAVADEDGFFEFEDVDLTSTFAGAIRNRQRPVGTNLPSSLASRASIDGFNEARLLFIAQDVAGKRGFNKEVAFEILTCFSGNFTWSAKPLPKYQSPTFLSIERLREGSENIFFYFNFTYNGRGTRALIQDVLVTKACGDFLGTDERNKRYNTSCEIMGDCTARLNPDRTTAYVACRLDQIEGIELANEDQLKLFLDGLKNEIAFPLKITLTYEEELPPHLRPLQQSAQPTLSTNSFTAAPTISSSALPERTSNVQTFCEEVAYDVDAAYINPKDVLPDWLLYDFVDYLNETITVLTEWLEKIKEILEWLAISCVAAFLLKFIVQIYRRITCHYDRFFKAVKSAAPISTGKGNEDKCKECVTKEKEKRQSAIDGNEKYKDPAAKKPQLYNDKYYDNTVGRLAKEDAQDILSDTCLEVCYQSCSSAWKAEELMYQTYRWACDRVFGHAAPSRWTETKDEDFLFQKVNQGKGCTQDQSVKGQPVKPVSCRSLESKYIPLRGGFGQNDQCVEVQSTKAEGSILKRLERAYRIGNAIDTSRGVYEMSAIDSVSTVEKDYIIKQNENNYLYKRPETCEEVCTKSNQVKPDTIDIISKGPQSVDDSKIAKADSGEQVTQKLEPGKVQGLCMIANECTNLEKEAQKAGKDGGIQRYKNGEPINIKEARAEGYTADCWTKFAPAYLSGNPNERVECCCINPEIGAKSDYYIASDVESKADAAKKAVSFEDMRWSYRYFKINWRAPSGATAYHPNRYISGRDLPACLGRNHVVYDGISGKDNLLIIDPIKQHVAAFQCLAVSQIFNRLTLLKNILQSFQSCLLQIRTTGKADAGVCKELFSQFLCSFLWKIISWVIDGCLPFGKGLDFSASENSIAEAVGTGLKGISESIEDTQTELAREYGNAKLNNLLGIGTESVFRKVCLAAFGYDWEIGLDDIIDVAYDAPFATLVQAVLPSREFITFDPIAKQAQYEYRSSWLINPGCDLDGYRADLACVTQGDIAQFPDVKGVPGGINCGVQGDRLGRNCDCLTAEIPNSAQGPQNTVYGARGREEFFFEGRGPFRQNELLEVDSSQIQNKIKTAPYRYDHLKFTLFVGQEYIRNNGNTKNCFPEGHENGVFYFPIRDYTARDIIGCVVSNDGTFDCSGGTSFFFDRGDARIEEISLNLQKAGITDLTRSPDPAVYYAGDGNAVSATVKYFTDGKTTKCLVGRLTTPDGKIIQTAPLTKALESQQGTFTTSIATTHTLTPKEIGATEGELDIFSTNPTSGLPEKGKISFSVIEKTGIISAEGILEFIDKSNPPNGIEFSQDSVDQIKIGTTAEKPIKDYCGQGKCIFTIAGARVEITSVKSTDNQANKYSFAYSVKSASGATTTLAGQTNFILHLDIRQPDRTEYDSCSVVAAPGYEGRIIVSGGVRQSIDIPIVILPGKRNDVGIGTPCVEGNQAVFNDGTSTYTLTEREKFCTCGANGPPNCPYKQTVNGQEKRFEYCYGQCRKYNKCETGKKVTLTGNGCVCDVNTAPDKYDCGGVWGPDFNGFVVGGDDARNPDPKVQPQDNAWACYQENTGVRSCLKFEEKRQATPNPSTTSTPALKANSFFVGGINIINNPEIELKKDEIKEVTLNFGLGDITKVDIIADSGLIVQEGNFEGDKTTTNRYIGKIKLNTRRTIPEKIQGEILRIKVNEKQIDQHFEVNIKTK